MKVPHRAILYGTGLILAFGAGWFFKPAPFSDNAAALSLPPPPAKRPGPPIPQKPANAAAASGANWLEAASADVAAIRAARQPGVVNQVLIDKLKSTLKLPDGFQRLATWQGLITEMRPDDAFAVQLIFRDLDQEGLNTKDEFRSFLHRWGSIDGPRAAASLGNSPRNAVQDEKIRLVMEGWGRQDADAAIAWIKTHGIGNVSTDAAISGLFQGLAATDFGAAEALLLKEFNPPDIFPILAQPAMFKVQHEGVSAAATWFKNMAGGDNPEAYKRANLHFLIQAVQGPGDINAYRGPMILDLVKPYAIEPWLPSNAGLILGSHWSKNDPVTGMAEIQQMTAPAAQKVAIDKLASRWAASEPEAFSLWLTQNSSHPLFDQAAFQLTKSLKTSDPEAAQAWAAQIKDPDLKSKAAKPAPLDPFATGQ